MPRKRRECGSRGAGKSIIKVFCEGESEQAYTEYLKRKFSDVAVIQYPKRPCMCYFSCVLYERKA